MRYNITEAQFTAAMEEAVQERGEDFTYPLYQPGWDDNGCRYVRSDVDEPACLIGVALFKCGVSLTNLSGFEGQPATSVLRILTDLNDDVWAPAFHAAAFSAQRLQDAGRPWGDCLKEYKLKLKGSKVNDE
jgi:hypothetical protein